MWLAKCLSGVAYVELEMPEIHITCSLGLLLCFLPVTAFELCRAAVGCWCLPKSHGNVPPLCRGKGKRKVMR